MSVVFGHPLMSKWDGGWNTRSDLMSKTIRSSHDVICFPTTITMYSSLSKISSVLKEKKIILGLVIINETWM